MRGQQSSVTPALYPGKSEAPDSEASVRWEMGRNDASVLSSADHSYSWGRLPLEPGLICSTCIRYVLPSKKFPVASSPPRPSRPSDPRFCTTKCRRLAIGEPPSFFDASVARQWIHSSSHSPPLQKADDPVDDATLGSGPLRTTQTRTSEWRVHPDAEWLLRKFPATAERCFADCGQRGVFHGLRLGPAPKKDQFS